MDNKKIRKTLVEGAISPVFIGDAIAKHSVKKNIGAHSIFLGQVRQDELGGKNVLAINYTAYPEMAEEAFHTIRESAFEKYELTCMHIYHSIGVVNAGEICLFVFVSSKHRKNAFDACEYIVERIKKEVPVWGQEILEDNTYQWKENT